MGTEVKVVEADRPDDVQVLDLDEYLEKLPFLRFILLLGIRIFMVWVLALGLGIGIKIFGALFSLDVTEGTQAVSFVTFAVGSLIMLLATAVTFGDKDRAD